MADQQVQARNSTVESTAAVHNAIGQVVEMYGRLLSALEREIAMQAAALRHHEANAERLGRAMAELEREAKASAEKLEKLEALTIEASNLRAAAAILEQERTEAAEMRAEYRP